MIDCLPIHGTPRQHFLGRQGERLHSLRGGLCRLSDESSWATENRVKRVCAALLTLYLRQSALKPIREFSTISVSTCLSQPRLTLAGLFSLPTAPAHNPFPNEQYFLALLDCFCCAALVTGRLRRFFCLHRPLLGHVSGQPFCSFGLDCSVLRQPSTRSACCLLYCDWPTYGLYLS